MKIPFSWLAYEGVEPRGRWDSGFVCEILAGNIWLPPGGLEFAEIPADFDNGEGRVVLFPCGFYVERGSADEIVRLLSRDLDKLEWSVLIALSDEGAQFPWPKVTLPESCRLWIQEPQPEKPYPIGTRFMPLGPQTPPRKRQVPLLDGFRPLDVYFQGQVNNERRQEMWDALKSMRGPENLLFFIQATGGFAQGVERDFYLRLLEDAWIAPAPSGPCTQDTFRLYEALDAGCIPIVDKYRPGGEGDRNGEGYWDYVFPHLWNKICVMSSWDPVPGMIPLILERRHFHAAWASAHWQQLKRKLAYRLQDDCGRLSGDTPSDQITVIVPTSPVPSNPDLSMIQATIQSVRERLPHAEILITCDGVRPEQEIRRQDYEIFVHELTMWCNTEHNVCPWVFGRHLHQSGMLRAILPEVTTPYLLYVEQDCPLEGEIPFDQLLWTMKSAGLNSMRFYHDVALTDGSEHLFLTRWHDVEPRDPNFPSWIETLQFSQRPHVARTDWYREIVDTYFGAESRTFIEDVMHGVVQAGLNTTKEGTFASRKQADEAWKRWRLAVYSPDGSWKRSGHLDGRGGDPKYPLVIAYDGEQPEGARTPGTYEA